ncbi:hypothetical protein FVEN_g6908 [Fusarium venenatum]|uniref:Uncharacterized protein n=1 Tax=Fusarium venenatum TaxID=56646 RepID=A0A2L2TUK6_9HYPO|nr:uncharacterized protein FVRRES_09454 [Fusarium venenatum]KAG8355195.1 hypothetical protein FVEN_g6908 [Fusarium venenatum]KAH6966128.1 hypothetical protein EDB82DRAFT_541240 [Fusarium venenatum]CEI69377.1 unnamed protein product [Fusarium venenatum]
MPKGPPNRRSSYRARPYGNWSVTYSQHPQQSDFDHLPDANNENQDPTVQHPVAEAEGCAPDANTQPVQGTTHQENPPIATTDDANTWENQENQPPRGPRYGPWRRPYYDSYRPSRDITMVDSMVLQSIGRTGSRAPPGLAIHSNSRGGGTQFDVFTKVPNTSKTIAFRVESEETLLQAYRQVKAMNPSTSVGGVMFSVAPKPESPFTEIDNVRWGSLTGRRSFASRFTPASSRAFRNGRTWTLNV